MTGYVERRFLTLQQLISLEILETLKPSSSDLTPKITIQRMPYASWLDDLFYSSAMSTMVTLMVMMSFMYNFINTVRAITSEKEMQLKVSSTELWEKKTNNAHYF